MQNETKLENIDKLFEQAYKRLGRRAFVFISPTSLDPEIELFLPRFESRFRSIYRKHKQLIDQFISQIATLGEQQKVDFEPITILDIEPTSISKPTLNWILATNQYFQMRWKRGLPQLAEYGIEFFIPPATDQQKAEYKALGIEETDLKATIQVDLPYSVIIDPKGDIDLEETSNFEQKFYLIRSKLAGLTRLRYASSLLANKLKYFPSRPFFAITQAGEIEQIAEELVQRVFDNMMHYAYSDLLRGLPPAEAKKNGFYQVTDMAKKKQLEELMVFRAPEDMSMDLYVLDVLGALKEFNPKIKQQTLNDFYKHIFVSLTQIIRQSLITPGNFFLPTIREASETEMLDSGHEYTLEIQSITDAGDVIEGIKEYYKFELTEQAFKDLLIYSTNGFAPDQYFL